LFLGSEASFKMEGLVLEVVLDFFETEGAVELCVALLVESAGGWAALGLSDEESARGYKSSLGNESNTATQVVCNAPGSVSSTSDGTSGWC